VCALEGAFMYWTGTANMNSYLSSVECAYEIE
jgi:hypothetical protein